MSSKDIHYLENQFLNQTFENRKLMSIVSTDHLAKLAAASPDPFILSLKTRYQPVHDDYIQKYVDHITAKALYKSSSKFMYDLLDELAKTKIKQWDAQVGAVYVKGSAKYLEFLPNGHTPFIKGNIDQRINETEAFADRLVGYPVFDVLRIDVNTFHLNLKTTRSQQQQKEERLDETSQIVELARIAAAEMMYRNLGLLMDKFGTNPHYINNYWEFELIMRKTKPEEDEDNVFVLFTNMLNSPYNLEIGLNGVGDFDVDFNDGTIETVSIDNSSYFFNHTYSQPGTKIIKIKGPVEQLTEFHSNNSQLTGALVPLIATALVIIVFQNNNFNSEAVNNLLVTLDEMGMSNIVINLIGNAAPTGVGIAAKNNLIARGCTVLTN